MPSTVYKSKNEIPTIDVALVTIETVDNSGTDPVTYEFGFDTANQIETEVQVEEQDAVRLVVKGKLRAQKPKEATITGVQITLHDNVFNPELVKILQGGTITYDGTSGALTGYTPPVAGSDDKGTKFKLNAYSAQYNAAGTIVNYEKTSFPNCQGDPIAFNSEDGAFRAPEYVINSMPNTGEAPYAVSYVSTLPTLTDPATVNTSTDTTNGNDG